MDEGVGYQLHDASPHNYDALLSQSGFEHLITREEGLIRVKGADASSAMYMLRAGDTIPPDAVVRAVIVDGEPVHPTGAQDFAKNRIRMAPSGSDLLVQRSDGTNHDTLATVTPSSLSDVDVQLQIEEVAR